MHTIKKYFIPPMDGSVDHSIVNNNKLNYNVHKNSNKEFELNGVRQTDHIQNEDRTLRIKCDGCNASNSSTTKIMQLSERVSELMSELQDIKSSDDRDRNENSAKIQQLTDQLALSNKKIYHYRDQIMQLKNDLQLTKNALSNEIGSPELMQEVLTNTGSSNFRGRAQQILKLQQKINELQATNNNSSNRNEHNLTVKRQTEKIIADQDLKDAQMKVSELENALQIWKTRAKTLEVEIPVIRVKNEKLLSQASKDKQLIEKLKVESNDCVKKISTQQLKAKDTITELKQSVKFYQSKTEEQETTIKRQKITLDEKNKQIAKLESKINQNKTNLNQEASSIDFSSPKDTFIKKLNDFENQQLISLLCAAHGEIFVQNKTIADFKDKLLMKSKTQLTPMQTSKLSKQKSYSLKHEQISNEELTKLKNKLELAEEERAAFKARLDSFQIIHTKHVQEFSKALNNMKLQFINDMKC